MDINAALEEYAEHLSARGVEAVTHDPNQLRIPGVLVQPGAGLAFDAMDGYRLDVELVVVVERLDALRVRERLSAGLTQLRAAGVPMPNTPIPFGSVPIPGIEAPLPCIAVPVPIHVTD